MNDQSDDAAANQPQRPKVWPAVAILVLLLIVRFGAPILDPSTIPFAVLGGAGCGLLLGLWYLLFSRAPARDRLVAGLGLPVVLALTFIGLDKSLATSMGGLTFPLFALPAISAVFVFWLVFGSRLPERRVALIVLFALVCAPWLLVRTGGFTGGLEHDFAWRWSATAEERMLADTRDEVLVDVAPTSTGSTVAQWPGFRGRGRNGHVAGAADWSIAAPVELWRRAVGPAWSSFAVLGERVYTQEQRGEEEVVSCYALRTGEPVWRHATPTRFWESNSGAGPRATPTVDAGRVYALGARGVLNVLDAYDGGVIWSRDLRADTGQEPPEFGFASSPLVTAEHVIVAATGSLIAYDLDSGEPAWQGPANDKGYSSAQALEIDGVEQVVFMNGAGSFGHEPNDGRVLWQHEWPGDPIVQPAATADGDVLVNAGERSGVRRLDVRHEGDGWIVEERWTSSRLKPFFNDYVVHAGHAFGFDAGILACVELAEGQRVWKGGRYGHGQLVLVPERDLLVVVSEAGEIVLVRADANAFEEIARVQAIEGKTWNHPVLVDDLLLVRNAQEMAAFTFAPAER